MSERQENLRAFVAAAIVHLAILAPMVIALDFPHKRADIMASAIPAVAISAEDFDRPRREAQARAQREAEQRQREQEAQRQRELQAERERQEQARREREAEQRRQAEVAEAARHKAAEEQRKADAEAARRKAAEEQRKAEAEAARRKAAEEQRKAEKEAARRKAEAEAKLQAEREAALQAEIAAEQSRISAIRAGKLDEWIAMMQQKAERYFSPPLNAGNDFYCEVAVRLIPGGDVASATTRKCDSEQLARAAEAAIWKAAPFPMPSDPSVFERNVTFIFDSPETE